MKQPINDPKQLYTVTLSFRGVYYPIQYEAESLKDAQERLVPSRYTLKDLMDLRSSLIIEYLKTLDDNEAIKQFKSNLVSNPHDDYQFIEVENDVRKVQQ